MYEKKIELLSLHALDEDSYTDKDDYDDMHVHGNIKKLKKKLIDCNSLFL
jgi:hypothetical protein